MWPFQSGTCSVVHICWSALRFFVNASQASFPLPIPRKKFTENRTSITAWGSFYFLWILHHLSVRPDLCNQEMWPFQSGTCSVVHICWSALRSFANASQASFPLPIPRKKFTENRTSITAWGSFYFLWILHHLSVRPDLCNQEMWPFQSGTCSVVHICWSALRFFVKCFPSISFPLPIPRKKFTDNRTSLRAWGRFYFLWILHHLSVRPELCNQEMWPFQSGTCSVVHICWSALRFFVNASQASFPLPIPRKKFTDNRTSLRAWGGFYFLWILHHLSVRPDLCNQEMWPFQSGTCSVVHICWSALRFFVNASQASFPLPIPRKKFTDNRTSLRAWGRFYFLWILHHLSVRPDLCNQEMWPFQSGTCSVVHICWSALRFFVNASQASFPLPIPRKKFTENRTSITAWGSFYFLWILHHLSVRPDLCNQEMWPFQSGTCSVVHICWSALLSFANASQASFPLPIPRKKFTENRTSITAWGSFYFLWILHHLSVRPDLCNQEMWPFQSAHVVLCISADLLCDFSWMLPKHPFRCLSQGRSSQKIEHPSRLEGASIFCEFFITCLLGQISAIRKCGPSSLAHVVLCISADLLCYLLRMLPKHPFRCLSQGSRPDPLCQNLWTIQGQSPSPTSPIGLTAW